MIRTRNVLLLLVSALLIFGVLAPASAQTDPSTMVITSLSDISTLDPALGYDTLAWPTISLLYRGLVAWSDDGSEPVPAIAESVEVSDDGLTYTFVLRDGVMFSNGREITADDIQYSFERVMNPVTASPGSFMYSMIAGVDAFVDGSAEHISGIHVVDDRTVEFVLANPEYTFLQRLALPFGSIVAQEAVEAAGPDFARMPVGAGPYVLNEWVSGTRLSFSRNPSYYREGYPKIDNIVIEVGVDPSVGVLRIDNGDADLSLDVLPSGDYPRIAQDPNLSPRLFAKLQPPNVIYLTLNTRSEPFNNHLVRQALSMAIDRERLVQILNNRATPADGPFAPSAFGNNAELEPTPYDPEGAQALLDEAGFAGLSTQLYTYTDPTLTAVAQAVAQDWTQIGVNVEFIPLDFAPLLDIAFGTPEQLPVMLIDWYLDYPDPSNYYEPLIACNGSFNIGGYCDPALDEQEHAAALIPPGPDRWAAFADLEAAIAERTPIISLYHITQYYYTNDRLRNLAPSPAWIFNFENATLE
ncbi:MAG: ABC transporter substrate-binding protein [Chloroflexota bacterium]